MSADPDKATACPKADKVVAGTGLTEGDNCHEVTEKKRKKGPRLVTFPDEDQLVTQYFEPANPWHDVPSTTRAQLAAEYLEACRRHNTTPIDSVLQQIRELPENSIGGGVRAGRLTLASCSLVGSAPVDALEALLRKVQFHRVELDQAEADDEGAEALFDMIEYYESANVVCVSGERRFGIRGWQAACRMIKKSAELSELEVCEGALCASHAPVLVRALRPHTCRLRALCLQRVSLQHESLLCLVIALKSNSSIRELRLPDNQLSASDAQQLGSLLRLNLHIQLLDLSNNMIQDAGTGHIADALVEQASQTPPSAAASPLSPHHFPFGYETKVGLAFLVLWNNQLTRNCAPHLSKALRASQSLCVLNIGRNALGTECVRALQCGGALVSLGLQAARLTHDSAQPLAHLVRQDTKLQRLDLRDNRLGVVGLQAILSAMKENTTLTQIDLDDPAESTRLSAEDSEAAIIARLTRDIAALCRRNEPPASEPERRVHRKISLTCHTAAAAKAVSAPSPCVPESTRYRTSRLRSPAPSPAPSPAGSPIPHTHSSRFSVTRVTPERECPPDSASPSPSPLRTASCSTPSRFKVVQVVEPPSIQVHPATQKRSSRFSVTRNFDAMYNPSPSGSPSASPTPGTSPTLGVSSTSSSPISGVTVSPSPVTTVSPIPEVSISPTPGDSISPIPRSPTPGVAVLASAGAERFSPTAWVSSVTPTVMICDSATPGVLSHSTLGGVCTSSVEVQTTVLPTLTVAVQTSVSTTPTVCAKSNDSVTGISSSVSPMVITLAPTTSKLTSTTLTAVTSADMTCASPTILTRVSTTPETMTNVSPTPSDSTETANIFSASRFETSAIKTDIKKITPSIVAVPSGTNLSHDQNPTVFEPPLICQNIDITCQKTKTDTIPEVLASKNSDTRICDCIRSLEKSDITSKAGTNKNPVSAIETEIESTLGNDTVEVQSNIASSIETTPSHVIMTGMSETVSQSGMTNRIPVFDQNNTDVESLATLKSVSLSSKESELFTNDPIAVASVGHGNLSDFDTGSSICMDKYQFEPELGIAATPKTVLAPKFVPNTTFAISPIPENFGVTRHEDRDIKYKDISNIAKPVVIGSHTNVATGVQTYTDKTLNIEADILMKIAEFTEKMTPKLVETEPKVMFNTIDLNKNDTLLYDIDKKTISEVITNRNSPISAAINIDTDVPLFDVSSHIGLETKYSKLDKSLTDTVQPILPLDYKDALIEKENITELHEQTKAEEPGQCTGVKYIPTGDPTQTVSVVESYRNKEAIDKSCSKYINEELRLMEMKPELSKNIAKETVIEEVEMSNPEVNIASYLRDINTAVSKTPDIDKIISDTKKSVTSDESVKNKTYSDVVKSDPKYKDKSEQLTHKEEISDSILKTETKLVKSSVEMSESDKVDVQIEVIVKKESVQDTAKVHSDQNKDFVNIDIIVKNDGKTMTQIEEITQDLGNLIQEMKHMSSKNRKVKSDCTVDLVSVDTNKVPGNFNTDVVLKKNKSESSLDSPDLEVSRLMNKKLVGSPFCDSSSSLEISGSSMESLNAVENQHVVCHVVQKPVVIQESVESDTELDRRKDVPLSTESSMESTSDVTPVNSGNFLNMSVSSNESVSPIIFGLKKKIHDSLSSLEASMSSLDSGRQEKVMVTSADSGIEYSLQHPSENKEDNSSNEGTLTHNSSLKETVKKTEQETLTPSPKRASSLLDVPALKTKGLDRMRKISWVAPSSSFHIPRPETEKVEKPSHLEKLLSLFQHPTSLFSRGAQSDEERKSASNTPPRKDSSLTSSFWSWGSTIEREKDDKDDSSEATDSTLSERVQVSFVDESFSKKLDSKTPSTDTDNTLSEFQSFPTQPADAECNKVTENTTDENLVQKCLDLSLTDKAGSNGNRDMPKASDMTDLNKPNDLNRNYELSSDNKHADDVENKSENKVVIDKEEPKLESIRPRSFAAVLKSSGSENSLDKQPSPDSGQPVDKLPTKVIRGIKENISPENTLTSSMTNTKTLALELAERQVKNQPVVNTVWEVTNPLLDKSEDLAPIATIDETCDEAADNTVNIRLEFIDDVKTDEKDASIDSGVTLESAENDKVITVTKELENVDLGKDALSYLIYESQDFEPDTEHSVTAPPKFEEGSLAQELKDAEIKEMLDLSPELVIDDALGMPDVFTTKEIKGMKSSPVIPERAKLKKSNSLEDLSQRSEENAKSSPKTKTIAFKVPETTSPRDIPERRPKLRTMSGSSPKSLPESLNKPSPLAKLDTAFKKRKKVSSLGKIAKDSLLALNMSEDEIAEYRRSYVTSVESLRSLESVSEDANSQSGTSVDSRCRSCLRTSQESLMSLDSITEDCKCGNECEKAGRSLR